MDVGRLVKVMNFGCFERINFSSFNIIKTAISRNYYRKQELYEILLGVCRGEVREYELTNTICASV